MDSKGPDALRTGGVISGHTSGVGALLTPLSRPLADFPPPGFLNIRDAAGDLLGRRSHPLDAEGASNVRRTGPEHRHGSVPAFRRLVDLSQLGWAFVCASVLWTVFAVALSLTTGWGQKGTPFFALGLGVLVFGFFLKTGQEPRPLHAVFLGANAVVLSVLSLIVATR